METAVLKIIGMECDACVGHVAKALHALTGVEDVAVSLAENTARVTFDTAQVGRDAMKSAVEDEGYEVG